MKTKLETACASSRISSSKIISLLNDKTIIPTTKALQLFLSNEKIYYQCGTRSQKSKNKKNEFTTINTIQILNKFKNNKIIIDINIFKQYLNDINTINNKIKNNFETIYIKQLKIIEWCIKYNNNLYTQEILELICNSPCIIAIENIKNTDSTKIIENFIQHGCVVNINCLENLCKITISNKLIQYVCQTYNILPTQKCLENILTQLTQYDQNIDKNNIIEYILQNIQCDHTVVDCIINNYKQIPASSQITFGDEKIDKIFEKYIFNSTYIIFTTDDLIRCINNNIHVGIKKLVNNVPLNYECLLAATKSKNYLLLIEIINKNIDPTIEILKLISNNFPRDYDYIIDAINIVNLIINKGILPDDECLQIATKNISRSLLQVFYKNLQNYTFTINQLYDVCKLQLADAYKQIITQINPDYHCLELVCYFSHRDQHDLNFSEYIQPKCTDAAFEIITDLVNTWKYLPTNEDIKNLCKYYNTTKILNFFKTIGYNFDDECISNILQYGLRRPVYFFVDNNYLFSDNNINILIHRINNNKKNCILPYLLMDILDKKNNKLTLEQLKQIKSMKKLRPNMISKLIDYVE